MKYRNPTVLISAVSAAVIIAASVLLLGNAAGKESNAESLKTSSGQKAPYYTLTVYIDENYSENDARMLHNQIKEIPNIISATFISHQQAMEEFMEMIEDPSLVQDVDEGSFRDRYIVLIYITDIALIEQTISDLQRIQGVNKIAASVDMDAGTAFSELATPNREV